MAKAHKGDVIFQRGKNMDQEDVWDDTALIEAYERAANLAYDAVRENLRSHGEFSAEELSKHSPDVANVWQKSDAGGEDSNGKKKGRKKKKKSKKSKWEVGDRCLAKYSEDGQWYEATILALDRDQNRCTVRYVEYENEEDLNLGALQKVPKTSVDEDSGPSEHEEELGNEDETAEMRYDPSQDTNISTIPLVPPPIPPHLLRQQGGAPDEDEAMAAMLMSWYTSGYHTGYYQAIRDMNRQKK